MYISPGKIKLNAVLPIPHITTNSVRDLKGSCSYKVVSFKMLTGRKMTR